MPRYQKKNLDKIEKEELPYKPIPELPKVDITCPNCAFGAAYFCYDVKEENKKMYMCSKCANMFSK